LVDQGHQYHSFINFDSESGPERPGLFQVVLQGIGHIKVYVGYERIAELKIDQLVRPAIDVLASGPVYAALEPGIDGFVDSVRALTPSIMFNDRPHWPQRLESEWINTLCRILLRIRNYGHGGAILINARDTQKHLNLKYTLEYNRLNEALVGWALNGVQKTYATDAITEFYDDPQFGDELPVSLYLDEVIHAFQEREYRTALEGAVWFVSLLSRVDGLVLLRPDFGVRAFGVEITIGDDPPSLNLASTASATPSRVRKGEAKRFGMRHRSMIRYCAQNRESVGFVVSQDGDVRAVTQVRGQVVMWENVRLQFDDFIRA
jgi:hypothetical protein